MTVLILAASIWVGWQVGHGAGLWLGVLAGLAIPVGTTAIAAATHPGGASFVQAWEARYGDVRDSRSAHRRAYRLWRRERRRTGETADEWLRRSLHGPTLFDHPED